MLFICSTVYGVVHLGQIEHLESVKEEHNGAGDHPLARSSGIEAAGTDGSSSSSRSSRDVSELMNAIRLQEIEQ